MLIQMMDFHTCIIVDKNVTGLGGCKESGVMEKRSILYTTDPFSWKFLAYSWGVSDKHCRLVLASAMEVAQDTRSKEVIEIDILEYCVF